MNLRRFARGKECQVRIVGHCNRNPETVVLCHLRTAGVGGMGIKPPNLCAVIACSDCHDVIDRRVKTEYNPNQIDVMVFHGLIRTLALIDGAYDIKEKS